MQQLETVGKIRENMKKTMVGKDRVIDLMLIALICSGHVLIEDVPGLGKTALVSALADSLKSGDATVLLAHLGGDSRRDELSDKFIDVMLPAADYIVVLEAGNKDGQFSSYASANGIPIKVPAKKADAITQIAGLFGK